MRARNLKPGFFKNEDLADIEPLGRILFQGLWCMADREGRLEDRHRKIKSEILPYDNCDIDNLLTLLHNKGFIVRYSIERKEYIQVCNFNKHQNPHLKETSSELPPPPNHIDSGVIPFYVPPALRDEIYQRDKYKCIECGSEENLSIDHIHPRSRGGNNEENNLRTLCVRCNSSKGNRLRKSTGNSRTSSGNSGTSRKKHQPRPADSLNPSSLNPESLNPIKASSPSTTAMVPFQKIIELWNTHTPETLPRASLTDKRKPKIKAAWKEYPDLAWWQSLFTDIALSDWHSHRDRWQGNSFDWMLKNRTEMREKLNVKKGVGTKPRVYAPPKEPDDLLAPASGCPVCGGKGIALNPAGSREKYSPCKCLHPISEVPRGAEAN